MTRKAVGKAKKSGAKATEKTGKNRRYRNAKISEYRLRKVVECFARDMSVKDTASQTRLSRQSADIIFTRLRERMRDHGLVKFDFTSDEPHPVRFIVNEKHRGAPAHTHDLYAVELIHRGLIAHNLKGFEELSASNPNHVKKAIRLHGIRQNGIRRYAVIEQMKPKPGETEGVTRPFAPLDYEEDSTLLINERMLDAPTAFFRYLWKLLLRHPL